MITSDDDVGRVSLLSKDAETLNGFLIADDLIERLRPIFFDPRQISRRRRRHFAVILFLCATEKTETKNLATSTAHAHNLSKPKKQNEMASSNPTPGPSTASEAANMVGMESVSTALTANIIPDQEYLLQGSISDACVDTLRHRLRGLCDNVDAVQTFSERESVFLIGGQNAPPISLRYLYRVTQ